jgi:hypothetical protein
VAGRQEQEQAGKSRQSVSQSGRQAGREAGHTQAREGSRGRSSHHEEAEGLQALAPHPLAVNCVRSGIVCSGSSSMVV